MPREFEKRSRGRPSPDEEYHIISELQGERSERIYPRIKRDEPEEFSFCDTSPAEEISDAVEYVSEHFPERRMLSLAQQDCIRTQGVYISEWLRHYLKEEGIDVNDEGVVCISEQLRDHLESEGIDVRNDYEVLVKQIERDKEIELSGNNAFMPWEKQVFLSGELEMTHVIPPVEILYSALPPENLGEIEKIVNGVYMD